MFVQSSLHQTYSRCIIILGCNNNENAIDVHKLSTYSWPGLCQLRRTTTAERSVSAMRRILHWLRSTMLPDPSHIIEYTIGTTANRQHCVSYNILYIMFLAVTQALGSIDEWLAVANYNFSSIFTQSFDISMTSFFLSVIRLFWRRPMTVEKTYILPLSFLPRCMECRRGIAMVILSVCPSVRPSVKRVHCDKTKESYV